MWIQVSVSTTIAGSSLLSPGAFAAPRHVDPRFVLEDSVEIRPASADRSVVIIVREQYVRQQPLPYECVFVDGEPAELLPQRSWFSIEVAPGSHCVSGIVECPPAWIRCNAGRSYLLRLREIVDAQDFRACNLLLDDPAILARLIERNGLGRVTTTVAGREYLRRKRNIVRACDRPLPNVPVLEAVEFEQILCERPLDRVNLETDFSLLTGRLTIDSTSFRYRLRARIATSFTSWRVVAESLEVRHDQVVNVHLGGTRFTGATPWVDVVYRGPDGLRTVSFSDIRETDGVATYNRIFEALRDCAFLARGPARDPVSRAIGGK